MAKQHGNKVVNGLNWGQEDGVLFGYGAYVYGYGLVLLAIFARASFLPVAAALCRRLCCRSYFWHKTFSSINYAFTARTCRSFGVNKIKSSPLARTPRCHPFSNHHDGNKTK